MNKHIALGKLQVMTECYFDYCAKKEKRLVFNTKSRLESGDLRFADLMRIQMQNSDDCDYMEAILRDVI